LESPNYTGTLTGGTGEINIGSGQFFKDANGNVGIGTSSPSTLLHLASTAGGETARIRFSCSVSAGYDSRIYQDDTGLNFAAISDSRSIVFKTGNSEVTRATIDGTGQQSSVVPGGTTLYPEYKCRAWVNFDGTTATPSTIRGNGNVSSVTKNATGDYTVNFTTAMPDANYGTQVTSDSNLGANANIQGGIYPGGTYSTTAVRIFVHLGSNGGFDRSRVCVSVFR
jgi:hypothetical protein